MANVQINPCASWQGGKEGRIPTSNSPMIAPVVLPRFEFDAARALRILAMLKSALVSAARHDVVVHSGIQNG